MTQDLAVGVEQGHAQVARRAQLPDVGIGGEEVQQAVGDVDQAAIIDDGLARRPGDVVLVVAVEPVADPERERAQPAALRQPLRDPRAEDPGGLRQVLHQLVEELLTGLARRSLHDLAKGLVGQGETVRFRHGGQYNASAQ